MGDYVVKAIAAKRFFGNFFWLSVVISLLFSACAVYVSGSLINEKERSVILRTSVILGDYYPAPSVLIAITRDPGFKKLFNELGGNAGFYTKPGPDSSTVEVVFKGQQSGLDLAPGHFLKSLRSAFAEDIETTLQERKRRFEKSEQVIERLETMTQLGGSGVLMVEKEVVELGKAAEVILNHVAKAPASEFQDMTWINEKYSATSDRFPANSMIIVTLVLTVGLATFLNAIYLSFWQREN